MNAPEHAGLPDWARAHGPVTAQARLRSVPEDFEVEEVLGFAADGDGEHVLLQVEKRGANTDWVARELARFAGLPAREVSYAGRKDRHAVTRQHFSVWLGRRPEPDWMNSSHPEYRVLSAARHRRKLRLGALRGNRFRIVLRDLNVPAEALTERLQLLCKQGVPNYFGVQRFGRKAGNIEQARQLLADPRAVHDRRQRGLLLSAARSLVFNAVLSERVRAGNWNQVLPGEACMLNGTHSVFRIDEVDDSLRARVQSGDVHPTGPLWGRGESLAAGVAATVEQAVVRDYSDIAGGLERLGLVAARRALRLPLPDLHWHAESETNLVLEFYLPAGSYATAVLRELADCNEAGGVQDAESD